MPDGTILSVEDLTVAYRNDGVWLDAVRDFSLQISARQTYGLVGESGSGKSTIALAIMSYLGAGGAVCKGQIIFRDQDLLSLKQAEMRQLWGRYLAMVPQNPSSSLNPSMRIGEQLAEILRHHGGLGHSEAAARAKGLLKRVRVPDPDRVSDSYPHQISGGMQQRVLVAMALSAEPELLVLDEPTTNLDVTTQAAILDLFRDLICESGASVLYVTHNLGVVARMCDRVAVLYFGELVEDAPVLKLFRNPLHPYTWGLLDSVPQLGEHKDRGLLRAIPGQIPSLQHRSDGCVFAPRCLLALERCSHERPMLEAPENGQRVRCHRWPEIASGEVAGHRDAGSAGDRARSVSDETVLSVDDLRVHFKMRRSLWDVLRGRPAQKVKAVDGLSMELERSKTLGVVGESGSGKTTLARAIVGLEERTSGSIELLGISLPASLSLRTKEMLRHVQYVFQNPEEALNPYMTIGETLRRPYVTLLGVSRKEADVGVKELLSAVQLPADYAQRLPRQLSGGEKQRVAIARAFAASPSLLLADEAVSALDVSVQASILNLLNRLQAEQGNALLFISHDLAVVSFLADMIAVVYAGQLMSIAAAADIFDPPYHPYTEALLSAIPVMDPEAEQKNIRLEGDVPSQIEVPSGCPFHPRCPRFVGEICADATPPWQMADNGTRIFCHITIEGLRIQQARVFQA